VVRGRGRGMGRGRAEEWISELTIDCPSHREVGAEEGQRNGQRKK